MSDDDDRSRDESNKTTGNNNKDEKTHLWYACNLYESSYKKLPNLNFFFCFVLFLLVNICWLVMRVVGSVVVLFWHLYTRRSSFQTKSAAILNEMRRVKVNVYTSYVLAYDTIMRKEI